MREIAKWITIGGKHIPIFKGETVKTKLNNYYRERYINNWKQQELNKHIKNYSEIKNKWEELEKTERKNSKISNFLVS